MSTLANVHIVRHLKDRSSLSKCMVGVRYNLRLLDANAILIKDLINNMHHITFRVLNPHQWPFVKQSSFKNWIVLPQKYQNKLKPKRDGVKTHKITISILDAWFLYLQSDTCIISAENVMLIKVHDSFTTCVIPFCIYGR